MEVRPPAATALLVLAHGAGAGMDHPFLEAVARGLAARRIATIRFAFPYAEAGRRRPDREAVLVDTVRTAWACARAEAPDLPAWLGGKSMGARMSALAVARGLVPASDDAGGPCGLVFLGFPLQRAGCDDPRVTAARVQPLFAVPLPMLFVQGTRDKLADLPAVVELTAALGPRAQLRIVEGADHGFAVLKRSGRTNEDALGDLLDGVAGFMTLRAPRGP